MFSLIEKIDGGNLFLPCTYTTFCCFQSFKELSGVTPFFRSETDCKVTTFFWTTKIFQKKYFIFLSNFCCFVSQATSLDCGCKGTTFFQTTKIFLNFFLKFFISYCISKRKIFILPLFLCLKTCFSPFFKAFLPIFRAWQKCFFRVFGFFCVFLIKKRSKIDLFFHAK